MGKKKFLNKKKAATFSLVYADTGDGAPGGGDGSGRIFARVDGGDSYVPGFSEEDPRSRPAESLGDGDDSRFGDAEEEEEEEEEVGGEEEDDAADAEPRSRTGADARGKERQRSGRLPENVRRELIELGFPDDGYDYNQHMRTAGSVAGGSSFVAIARGVETLRADVKAYDSTSVGVQTAQSVPEGEPQELELIRSGTRPVRKPLSKGGVLDAEVLAALGDGGESQFDSEDELEDEFLVLASEGAEEQSFDVAHVGATRSKCSHDEGGICKERGASTKQALEESLDEGELSSEEGDDHREISRYTSAERPARLLDEQFEKLALNEYDDFDSELDEDDPLCRGHADISQFSSVLSEHLNDTDWQSEKYKGIGKSETTSWNLESNEASGTAGDSDRVEGKAANTDMIVHSGVEDVILKKTIELGAYESDGEVVAVSESDKDGDEWDCETIVSTYSNLDNHPAKITAPGKVRVLPKLHELQKDRPIRLGGKEHLPLDYLPKREPEIKHGGIAGKKEGLVPKKVAGPRAGETAEEKRDRKASIKESRREARLAKKSLKICYREESHKAQHGAATMGPNVFHLP